MVRAVFATRMLVIGDSYVARLGAHLDPAWRVSCVGRPGARISDDGFRTWAVRTAVERQPVSVLLIVGGNDLARPLFRQQELLAYFDELAAGLLAAGLDQVFVLAIPPRVHLRATDAAASCFRRRRHLANDKLRRKFGRAPVMYVPLPTPGEFLGPDGVHPSAGGWRRLTDIVRRLL